MKDGIPSPVLERFARYLTFLGDLDDQESDWTCSRELALGLGLTGQTVRKDLSHLNFSGSVGKGYRKSELREALQSALVPLGGHRCAVVGAGNVGRALGEYLGFREYGFTISAIFDIDPYVVGTMVGPHRVNPLDTLAEVVESEQITMGIIAVPTPSAQETAEKLVEAGVKGLINFASAHVRVPESIPVRNVHFVGVLLELSGAMVQGTPAVVEPFMEPQMATVLAG